MRPTPEFKAHSLGVANAETFHRAEAWLYNEKY